MVDRFQMETEHDWICARPDEKGDWVRYSDYAELEAENERLTKELYLTRNERGNLFDNVTRLEAEALSRTGAVKVKRSDILTKIALWADDEGMDLSMGQGDDLAGRILSALEPAAPEHPANLADDDVDAAYQAALDNLPAEFRGEIGRGELDRMVRAIVKAHDSKWERRAKAMAHHHHSALQAPIDTSKPAAPEDYEALRTELEQVKRERDEFRDIAARKSNQVAAMIKAETAERLAGTRVVQLPRPDTVSMSGGAICLEYADYDLRDAAYDWLEAHGAGPAGRAALTEGEDE